MLGEREITVGDDALAFAGIAPPALRLYPAETQCINALSAWTPEPTGMRDRERWKRRLTRQLSRAAFGYLGQRTPRCRLRGPSAPPHVS